MSNPIGSFQIPDFDTVKKWYNSPESGLSNIERTVDTIKAYISSKNTVSVPKFNTGWSPWGLVNYQNAHNYASTPELEFDETAFQRDLDKSIKWADRVKRREANKAQYGNAAGIPNSVGSGFSAVGSILGNYAMSDAHSLSKGVDAGISAGLNMFGPVGSIADFSRRGIAALLKAGDLNIDNINPEVWKRQGFSKGSLALQNIAAGIGFIPAFGKVKPAHYLDSSVAGGWSGLAQDAMDMQHLAGKGLAGNLGMANERMSEVNKQVDLANQVAFDNKRKQNNQAGQMMSISDQLKFSGYKPGLSLRKKGGIIPELEEVRFIMLNLQSNKQEESSETQKFQLGGKMNMIVTGALHARKHNLEELNPVLEGEITKKGIPVITFDEGGEVDQQLAEVEQAEIIMTLDTTKTIEDYYKEYMDADTNKEADKAALDCGKFLVDQILKNTDDPDKLIKKTV